MKNSLIKLINAAGRVISQWGSEKKAQPSSENKSSIEIHGKTEQIINNYFKKNKKGNIAGIAAFLDNSIEHRKMMEEYAKVINNKTPERLEMIKNAVNEASSEVELLANSRIYYKTYSAITSDWDLKDTRAIEDAFLYVRKGDKHSENDLDSSNVAMENKERNAEKYKILKRHYMVLGTGKKAWNKGKKMIGIFYPTPAIAPFYYDEMVFIGPDVAQKQFGTQDKLDIIDRKTNKISTANLYAYIATHNYSDLLIYQYDDALWSMWAVKNGKKICLGKDAFTNSDAKLIIQALLIDIGENTNNQEFDVSGTIHKGSFDRTGEDYTDIPIGDKTFRVSMARQYISSRAHGHQDFARSIHIRLLDSGDSLRKIDEIGYYPEDLKIIHSAMINDEQLHVGCNIVAGPPSSGKSTALSSIFADLHDNHDAQIVTIDSSVEFQHKGFRQIATDDTKRASKEEKKVTITKAVNFMLKQYVDGLIVGEVRGADEIVAAVNGAARGRLMAFSVHTNDVRSIFTVLDNAGLKPVSYLPLLRTLLHHRLVPALCPKCKGTGKLAENGKEVVCENCFGTGSHDRELIYELAYLIPGKVPLDCNPSKDFDKLIASGAIIYRSAEDVARQKYKDGKISKAVYEGVLGAQIEKIKAIAEEMNKKAAS